MKNSGLISSALIWVLVLSIFLPQDLWSQTWGPKSIVIPAGNSNGYYEYLPAGYFDAANANRKYPVLISVHGIGENGNGTSDLGRVLNVPIASIINQGRFPAVFTVGGQQFSFIVICPQFLNWPSPSHMGAYIDYVLKTYRADPSRVYLTGLSMGGGVVFDYVGSSREASSRVAAIVPTCPAAGGSQEKYYNIASTNLAVWSTHNNGDQTVYPSSTIDFVNGINAYNPNPRAMMTIFNTWGHDSWTTTYDPNYKLDGTRNCYEWMLQFSRNSVAPVPSGLMASITSTKNPGCNGGTDGAATVSVSGGTAPYTYSWNTSPVQTGATATNLKAGSYVVTVKDAINNTATATAVISEPAKVVLTVTPGTITTNGGTTNVTLSATGGWPPYTYTGPTTNVKAGTYTYEVRDALGCMDSRTITITEPAPAPGPAPAPTPTVLSASISSTKNPGCNGGTDGAATVSVSGGTAPYTYSWNTSPVQTGATAINLKAGSYVVTVRDASNNTATATAVISEPAKVVLTVTPGTITTNGGSTNVTLSATGGWPPYTFTGPTTNVKAGTYTYQVRDVLGCMDSKTITITEPAPAPAPSPVSASISNVKNPGCNGGTDGAATVNVSGGTAPYTYSWNTSPVQTGATATNLKAGSYVVTVKDVNNNTATATALINEPAKVVLTIVPGTITANGGTTNVTLSATGGWPPYTYTGPTANVKAGTYTYEVRDVLGCLDSKTITITEPAPAPGPAPAPAPLPLAASISSTKNPGCNGGTDGAATVSVSGGTAPYTYNWNTSPVQTGATAINLRAGTYVVTVRDANNNVVNASAVIGEPAKLILSATPGTITTNGGTTSVILSATGGWPPYTFTGPTTNVKAGTYTYEVRDALGCFDNKTITITEPAPPPPPAPLPLAASISSTKNPGCNGGTDGAATVSVSGGTAPYTYNWNTSPVQTGATAIGLRAGSYVVTVRDANNNVVNASAVISEPAKLVLTATPGTITTNGGTTSVILSATGGWPPYTFTGPTTNVKAGTYTYEVRDAVGCTDNKTITITEPAPPPPPAPAPSPAPSPLVAKITDIKNPGCNGGSDGAATVSVTGGAAPYTYSWNTSPVQSGATATNLKAGEYSVIVKDGEGRTTTATVAISEPAILVLTVNAGTISIHGGSTNVSLNATGGTAPYVYTGQVADLKAGTYTFEVRDAAGCVAINTVTITEPAPPPAPTPAPTPAPQPPTPNPLPTPAPVAPDPLKIILAATSNVTCHGGNNGSATVSVEGGKAPYNVTWNTDPLQTGLRAINLVAGTYTVEVTDAGGNRVKTIVVIDQPAALELYVQAGNINSFGGATNVELRAIGGIAPYTYSGPTNNVTAGTYSYAVTDAAGCVATSTVSIREPERLKLNIDPETLKCNGGTTSVKLTATGGVPPYQFEGITTGLRAGTYSFAVVDATGTRTVSSITISEPAPLELFASAQDITKVGGTTFVRLNAKGGTTPYAYSGNVSNLKAGTYRFTVTDFNGCLAERTIELKEPAVTLAAFDPVPYDTAVSINWKTSYEYAIGHFMIEKSLDGNNYDSLGKVNSRASAQALYDYLLNDKKPAPAKNFYRISAITLYGEKLLLQEKSIFYNGKEKVTIDNLATRLNVQVSSTKEENVTFILYNMNGKQLKTVTQRKETFGLRVVIPMEDLPKGTYVLRVVSPTINTAKQVIRL